MGFWIFMHYPPREINGVYGYCTARSTASPEAWAFAHVYMGKLWFRMGAVTLLPAVAVMLPCMGKSDNIVGLWGSITVGAECVIMLLPVIPVERTLKKKFG